MEVDTEAACGLLEEIDEWLDTNEMGDALHGQAELAAILERISSLHLRLVP